MNLNKRKFVDKIYEAIKEFVDEGAFGKKEYFGASLSFIFDPITNGGSIDFYDIDIIGQNFVKDFHQYLLSKSVSKSFIKGFNEDWIDELK